MQKIKKPAYILILVILGVIWLMPNSANGEMPNNLSNSGCVTCHTDYPGIISPTNSNVYAHTITTCTRCHVGHSGSGPGPAINKMWNCRYCHLTTYNDLYVWPTGSYSGALSGFKSYWDPLRGAPLGSETKWMAGHFAGGSLTAYSKPTDWPIDADFVYHQNSPSYKHTSLYAEPNCINCHQNTLTSVHEGKNKVVNNPTEDFEDGAFTFNFSGDWGGDWQRVQKSPHAGSYNLKSALIGGNSVATTDTTVSVASAGTVSFWYRIDSEPSNDKLFFYIDGVEKLGGVSGSTVWTNVYYPLSAGTHKLKWVYSKNNSLSVGEDSAYIDDISISGASTNYTFDCNTCHLSSDPLVVSAIANKNTTCSACHTQADHQSVHQTGLDSACQSCHLASLSQEHIDNPITTPGKNYTCDTCHANPGKQYVKAIDDGNLNCSGCHQEGHTLSLVDNFPVDVPLYTEFQWSAPVDAAIFANEPTTPAGYDTGQVVMSNRRTAVTVNDVWNFYNQQLTSNGWQLKSAEPDSGAQLLTAEFEKAGRLVTIKCYNSETADGIGQPVSTGYRIEIWYKN